MPRPPQQWTDAELRADAQTAEALFNARRRAERTDRDAIVAGNLDLYRDEAAALLAATSDLRTITGEALKQRAVLRAARFAALPFISDDDLDTYTGAKFKNWMKQTGSRGAVPTDEEFDAVAEAIIHWLDTQRAPWVAAQRAPTKAEHDAFLQATITLRLNSFLTARRRTEGAKRQEEAVRQAVEAAGYTLCKPPKNLTDPEQEMKQATYSKARSLRGSSLDVPIRLPDNHPTGLKFLALEAKDSNSAVNTRKRLLEAAGKSRTWNAAGLPFSFRTATVVSGVAPLDRLKEAQNEAGVYLFWEHRLEDLTDFLR